METFQLYVASFGAIRDFATPSLVGTDTGHGPSVFPARSDQEAQQIALDKAVEKFPPNQGWSKHNAGVMRLTIYENGQFETIPLG